MTQMFHSWKKGLLAATAAVVACSLLMLLSRHAVLTTYDITPDWSPNSQTIVFVCYEPTLQDWISARHDGDLLYPPESSEICTMASDGTNRKQLTYNRVTDRDPTWSPDGTQIAFASNGSLYIMNADGSQQHAIPYNGYVVHPAWSPSGKQIVFSTESEGIDIVDLETGHIRSLAQDKSDSPVWSPNGRFIAFIDGIQPSRCEVHIIAANTGTEIAPPILSDCRVVAWSPDSTRLASVRPPNGNRSGVLFVVNLDTLETMDLTRGDKDIGDGLVWSSDGTHIYYPSEGELFVANADGSEGSQITHLGGSLISIFNTRSLALSAEGKQIAFSRGQGTASTTDSVRIWKVNIDGSNLIQLSP